MSDTQHHSDTNRERVFNAETRRALCREAWVGLCMAPIILLTIVPLYLTLLHFTTVLLDRLYRPLEHEIALVLAGWLLAAAGTAWVVARLKLIRIARESGLASWQAFRRTPPHYSLLTCCPPHCTPDATHPSSDESPARVFNAETRTALRRVLRTSPHVTQDGTANGGEADR